MTRDRPGLRLRKEGAKEIVEGEPQLFAEAAPLFGVVADLFGRRLLLAWGLILYGIFGAAMALAPTFTWLLVLRAMQGVAYSAVIPLTIVLIGDLLEGDHEIGGQGLKVFLDRVGYLILPPLGGLLATIAWYWPFTLYILTVPLGIAAFFWMPETKGERRSGTRAYLGDILRLTRHPRLLVAFSAGFLILLALSLLFLPTELVLVAPGSHVRGVKRPRLALEAIPTPVARRSPPLGPK